MSASYLERGMNDPAIFELFARRLPPHRDWLLVAGLGPTLELVRRLRFGERELAYLRSLSLFRDQFLDYLAAFRFSGDVEAIPEGTVCFDNEPLLRVTAPLIEAQLLETLLLNQINFQTMIATKAARVVLAAGGGEPGAGERVVDFSPRRDHGTDAAIKVARSAAVAGCGGTSNVAAAMRYGLRPVGTMAHSYVLAFDTEEEAFRSFIDYFPEGSVILVDTYDTLEGVRRAVSAARRAGTELRWRAARLRGPARALAPGARHPRPGRDGGDQDRGQRRPRGGAGSPSWSPPERRSTSGASAPTSERAATRRWSTGSTSWSPEPARRGGGASGSAPPTSRRFRDRSRSSVATANGTMSGDVIGGADEELEGEPLLVPAMRGGRCGAERVAGSDPGAGGSAARRAPATASTRRTRRRRLSPIRSATPSACAPRSSAHS